MKLRILDLKQVHGKYSMYFTFIVNRRLCFPYRITVLILWFGNLREIYVSLIFVSQDDIEDFVLSMSMRLVTTFSAETTATIFGGKVNVSLSFSIPRPWSNEFRTLSYPTQTFLV